MFNVELTSERIARERLETRRKREAERQERIFKEKVRTIGVDVKALDMQVEEKKARKGAYVLLKADAEDRRYNFEACVHQNRQKKKSREMEKALVNYRHQHQMPSTRREFDLNDPDCYRKLDPGDAQMMLPGLAGEEQDSKSRLKRQKEQLREWLLCQQKELRQGKLRKKRVIKGMMAHSSMPWTWCLVCVPARTGESPPRACNRSFSSRSTRSRRRR
uniref:RIB43A domain with coiled-coils 2 n=1 Tax=Nothobranchius furzeri TaxID=105023 RepID=A0A8C6VZG1_NOTFU